MTVGREEGEEGPPAGPPVAGGLVVGGTAEHGAQSEAPATEAAAAPPAEQETAAAKRPMTDQEAIDSFPTAKLNKLDELISNPRWVRKHCKFQRNSLNACICP